MLSPSTPRSTIASRLNDIDNVDVGDVHSQGGDSPLFISPGAKIKALLAEYDTDSDESIGRDTTVSDLGVKPGATGMTLHKAQTEPHNHVGNAVDDDDDSGDELPAPRGRLAARMLGGGAQTSRQVESGHPENLRRQRVSPSPARSNSDSEDGIRAAGRRIRPVVHSVSPPPPSPSRAASRSVSPLFVPMESPSPNNNQRNIDYSFSEELVSLEPLPPAKDRLNALAAQKRKEREERERQEAEKKAERMQRSIELGLQFSGDGDEDDDGDDEHDTDQMLTQNSRAPRKASKKAMLEMTRETQRMSRNMQLAHQAVTKKKITVESFLARFNQPAPSSNLSQKRNHTPSSPHPLSDNEAANDPHFTPPTSPLREAPAEDKDHDPLPKSSFVQIIAKDVGLDITHTAEPPTTMHAAHVAQLLPESKPVKRTVHVKISREAVAQTQNLDPDSELEVITSPSKARRLAIFENLTMRKDHQSRSLHTLRALANLPAPTRKDRNTITQAELEATLFRRAREQAAREREEKIRRLREKGIVIQTAEERTRAEDDLEDLVEKAREEADAISRKEKAMAKKGGEDEGAWSDDSENDGDYNGDEGINKVVFSEEDEEDSHVDSEDPEDDEEVSDIDNEDENDQVGDTFGLIDHQAQEEDDESELERSEEEISMFEAAGNNLPRRNGRRKRVVSDDEEDENQYSNTFQVTPTPKPQIPDLGSQPSEFMGLSQAFAATLADSQDDVEPDSLARLREMPGMDFALSGILEPDSPGLIRDNQREQEESGSLDLLANYTQASVPQVAQSPSARSVMTRYSQIPEPTQDAGFVMSPFDQTKRFLTTPHSTRDTVPLVGNDTPLAKRRMRRLRRGPQINQESDEEPTEGQQSALYVMRKVAKKAEIPYDKTKSNAKDIVDEAAEESDDEYAGLGGASDEDSGLEDEYDQQMINDESGEVVDEKELAALNANWLRERDERDVQKLMKDITTGALRRKRGGGGEFDLSESEDERIEARRRAKRREFAKMRKALLADEKLNKMADDPKKAAFLRSIEDRDYGDELDFLAEEYEEDNMVNINLSQDNGNEITLADTFAAGNVNKRKRPLDVTSGDALNRAPAKIRRKAMMTKPTSLAEIRKNVSYLLDGPEAEAAEALPAADGPPEQEQGHERADEDELGRAETTLLQSLDRSSSPDNTSDSDAHPEGENNQAATHQNPRRTRGKVVDRLSLRRAASSNLLSAKAGSKMAFYSNLSNSNSVSSFHGPPPLLSRRSTTSTTSSSSSGSGSMGMATEVSSSGGLGYFRPPDEHPNH